MNCGDCQNFVPKNDRIKDLALWLSKFPRDLPVRLYEKGGLKLLRVDDGNRSDFFLLPKWEEIK